MSMTSEEIIKEIISDKKLRDELIKAMNDPAEVAVFLKKHGCTDTVSEFIAVLDSSDRR